MSADELIVRAHQLHVLTCGEIDVEGRMPWSSNATFLVNISCEGMVGRGIYKPMRGEGCFGLVSVLDRGDHLRVIYSGRNHLNQQKIGLSFDVRADAARPAVSQK